MPAARINWDAVRERYVQGSESLVAIANDIDVNDKLVKRHSSEGGWVQQRKEFRAASAAASREIAAERVAEEIADRAAALGSKWFDIAMDHLARATRTKDVRRRKDLIIIAGIATDKWKLVTAEDKKRIDLHHSGTVGSYPVPVFDEDDPMNHFEQEQEPADNGGGTDTED